mmetsp:Transcript_14565/g.20577  ORF Transcript_14565/g.20577 Transcript_14565/m.20577 type:complete len:147 (+) Transcript_14565:110-550(+)
MTTMKNAPVKDPIGMYIMPLYAAASWTGMLLYGDQCMLVVSSFGAIWALMNTFKNKSLDAGWISMGLVAVASMGEIFLGDSNALHYLKIAGCVLASLNFMIPFTMWPKIEKLVQKKIRSMRWLKVFGAYLLVMAAFWMYSAYELVR